MTMLVQPRHIKLYYAGSAKNWELAAAEARDLRSSFDRIAQTIPSYEGNDVQPFDSEDFIATKIDKVDNAIIAGNPEGFTAASTGSNYWLQPMPHLHGSSIPGNQRSCCSRSGADSARSDPGKFSPSPQ